MARKRYIPSNLNEIPYGYATMGEVAEIYHKYTRFHKGATNLIEQNKKLHEDIISNLQKLYEELTRQEQQFFTKLNVNPQIGIQNLQGLQSRVDEWNACGAQYLLSEDCVTMAQQAAMPLINQEALAQTLERAIQTEGNPIRQTLETFGEEIAIVLPSKVINPAKGSHHSFSARTDIGLNATFEIVRQGNNWTVGRKRTEGETLKELSPQLSLRLARILEENNLGNDQTITRRKDADLMETLLADFKSHIHNPSVISVIKHELDRTLSGAYSYNYNRYVLKGWLAEIYWNACFNFLFKQTVTIPTGAIRSQGKQVSVDMIIQSIDAGFQIKSWSLQEITNDDGTLSQVHTTTENRRLGSFLQKNAQGLGAEVIHIISQMFGAISYNQPTNLEEYQTAYFPQYQRLYAGMEKELNQESLRERLEPLLQTQIGKIIGINKKDLQIDNQIYLNTFWLINDKIIPSSLIIKELISNVKESLYKSNLVAFQINNIKPNQTARTVWPFKSGLDESFADEPMANRYTLNYTVTFNLTDLITRAAKHIPTSI